MKYIFVINPMAGTKNSEDYIKRLAFKASKDLNDSNDYDFYVTDAPKSATSFVASYSLSHPDTDTCFIACGGDGTLNEVASGAVGHHNAFVSVFPCGSGNDYVKYYGGTKPFMNVGNIFNGNVQDVDIMNIGNRYSLNICNFGFDTTVADTIGKVKRLPLLGGKNSYYTGIAKALFTAMNNKCKVYADGNLINPDGRMLLCTLGNGSYVGGSFNCSPRSDNTDGLIEVCLVAPVSLRRFLKLLPFYQQGTHLEAPEFAQILTYTRAKSVEIEAREGFKISIDGEIADFSHVIIENIERAIRFVVPKTAVITPAKQQTKENAMV